MTTAAPKCFDIGSNGDVLNSVWRARATFSEAQSVLSITTHQLRLHFASTLLTNRIYAVFVGILALRPYSG